MPKVQMSWLSGLKKEEGSDILSTRGNQNIAEIANFLHQESHPLFSSLNYRKMLSLTI